MTKIIKPRILKPYETGTGILIEDDAGAITPDLNKAFLSEGVKAESNQPLYINCILQKWGVKNRNGRIYPEDVLIKEIERYADIINNNSSTGEADHPDNSVISLRNITHLITKMWWGTGEQSNVLYGKLKLIVTRGYLNYGIVSVVGDQILLYLENGIKIGISSRGVGSLKEVRGENLVQDDFELVGFDLVSSPSTFGAYLFPDENIINQQESVSQPLKENKKISAIDRFLIN
ncbi:MAG: hypothetical protein ACOCVF_00730 [bacterium]